MVCSNSEGETQERAPAIATRNVRELLGPNQMLYLLLDDATYTLRLTRNGRLILTK